LLDALAALVNEIGQLINARFRCGPHPYQNGSSEMSRPPVSAIRQWVLCWLAWTVAGLFYVSQDFVLRLARNEPIPWRDVFIIWMGAVYICAAFTPLILWLGRHWAVDASHRWRGIALHLGASVVFSLVSTALEVPVLAGFGLLPVHSQPVSFVANFWAILPYDLHGGIIRYWAVIGLQALFRSNQDARRREREALELKVQSSQLAQQLTASQLGALKMQMHPHFLFNTLSAIMVLVRQQKTQQAETMLSRLSDLLRHTLDDVETQEVPLWRELDFLRLYLAIEQVRFEDRLRVRIDAGPEVTDALVPHMVLQPIVENAVRHGLGQSEEPVLIHVSVRRVNEQLALTVADDGPGCPDPGQKGIGRQKGIGLTNTRDRLYRLYGEAATFSAENRVPRGVQVTMVLPYRTELAEDAE
jgi:two-component system LytT family sensor kinase